MEKKEPNPDLIVPRGIPTLARELIMFLDLLTTRVNLMWGEHLKKRGEKKDGDRR
ncbi:hypothetical protein [Wolbachia endosymbiont of Cimex lectularius]|uniref:hypothetical protein n=1 Tax=Wolbachia endosymbiont of Cimex lectularius TaxID=246273 RepID=UPI000ABD3B60|nr:hypothetical protein [Wolbachia endosymbiont of Cimex lectularius]